MIYYKNIQATSQKYVLSKDFEMLIVNDDHSQLEQVLDLLICFL
ncbi:hypothetical protein [Litchfieldia alkalitelluris]|nr:hypothetical protein [Litchfieldia alkalitelluris]